MKKLSWFVIAAFLQSNAYSQEQPSKYLGYGEIGYQRSYNSKDNQVNGFKLAYNSIITDKYLIGLNYVMAFEDKYLKKRAPDHINNYTLPYLNFGLRNRISKSVYLTPSVGIGYANYVITDLKGETTGKLKFDLTGKVTTEFTTTYYTYKEKRVVVPVNLNVLFTKKYFGLGLNFSIIFAKYMEMGAGLSLNFGKLRN